MDLGNRLKDLREEMNLTREELAYKLNISYSAVSKYETNVRFPDKETLYKLADYFNVSVDYLLGRSDIRKIETKAYHSNDLSGLPDEAIKQIDDYIDFIKQKYNSDGSLKK